jgi:antitoxin VapB
LALTIQDPELEQLAEEVAGLAHETKTEAIRKALEERRSRLNTEPPKVVRSGSVGERMQAFLERDVWPFLPPGERGKTLTKEETEELIG